jgi:hydroxyacylglutathione hydrolase
MKIDRLILGSFETNCYILRESEAAKDCLIIDTGLEADELINFLQQHKLNPVAVVLTHGHIDHVTGVAMLRQNFPEIKVYIHKLDAEMLTGTKDNLSDLAGQAFSTAPADIFIDEPDTIEQAGIRLDVFHTPGHTPGGVSLYSKQHNLVLVGDTLFAGSVGRTDFPNASFAKLKKSIKEKLFTLPDETVCLPGHGPPTTIAQEKTHNPFLQ